MKGIKSFMGQFNRQLSMVCEDVLKNATIEVMEHATADLSLSKYILDRREQILILLLGDGALNTQIGGKDIIVLKSDDHELFSLVQTRTISAFKKIKQEGLSPNALRSRLGQWSKQVQTYADKHPTTRQGHRKLHIFSDENRITTLKEGFPIVLRDGSAVMVQVGSDIGDLHSEEGGTFWEAQGRSKHAMHHIINHLGYWEAGHLGKFNGGLAKEMADAFLLPFIDIIPFHVKHKNDYLDATKLTDKYMGLTVPMIVVPYGELVSCHPYFASGS